MMSLKLAGNLVALLDQDEAQITPLTGRILWKRLLFIATSIGFILLVGLVSVQCPQRQDYILYSIPLTFSVRQELIGEFDFL